MATVRLQIRRGTASQWTSANPILAAGELGVETDSRKIKIGDGSTSWTSLSYIAADNPEISEIAQDAIDAALVAGTGIVKSYNDGTNTITVSVDTSVIATKAELAEVAQDSIDQALTAGTGITKNYDDAANTLTVSVDTSVIADKTYADTKLALAGGTMSGEIAMGTNKITGMGDPSSNQDAATKKYVDDEINNLGNNLNNTIGDYVPLSEKGTALGVATLDANVLVPLSQLTNATDYADNAALNAQVAAQSTASDALDAHNLDTTNVHGIADTTVLVTLSGTQSLGNKTIVSPTLTGTPVAPTANAGTNNTQVATTAYVDTAVAGIVDSAPAALNTLNELAAALGDDENFATTTATTIGTKVAKDGDTMTGALTLHADPTSNLHAATKQYVDGVGSAGIIALQNSIEDHRLDTTNIHGIANTADLVTTSYLTSTLSDYPLASTVNSSLDLINADIDGIENTLVTVNTDLSNINTSLNSQGDDIESLQTSTASHNALTANVHGISDAANLVYQVDLTNQISGANGYTDSSINTHNADTTNVHGITNTANLVYVSDLSAHTDDTTNVHGITDTADLVYTNDARLSDTRIPTDDTVSTVKIQDLAVTTAKIDEGAVTSAKIADGTIVNGDISASAAIDWTKLAISSTVSATELGYVDGVTSAIQTQLDSKASSADLTNHNNDTTNVHGIADTASLVTLDGQQTLENKILKTPGIAADSPGITLYGTTSSVNISNNDGAVAVSGDLQATGNLKVDGFIKASDTTGFINLNGDTTVQNNLTVEGDLTVNGTNFSASATSIVIEDNMVQLAHQNPANTVDLGLVVAYNDGAAKHSGIVRDVSANKWKLFKGVTTEPSTTVDFTQGSLDDLEVAGLTASSLTVGSVSNTEIGYLDGVTSAIQTQIDTKAPSASPTFTGTVVLPSTTSVGNVSSTEIGYLDGVTSSIQTQIDTKAPIASPTFTGTVTVAASGIAFTDKVQTKAGVPSLTTIGSAVSSNTTLDALGTDANVRDSLIPLSGAVNISFETTGNAKYAVGSSISFYQSSGTGANITGNGVTVLSTPGSTLRTTNSSVTATKINSTTWLLAGDLKA